MAEKTTNRPGRGWHGNSAGHARAGRLGGKKSRNNLKYNQKQTSVAGKRGGQR